nr:MAG TPA: hypothetical protein [Caudoviricetes sp.]
MIFASFPSIDILLPFLFHRTLRQRFYSTLYINARTRFF